MINFATEFVVEPLAPDTLFNIGPIPVTNSMLVGWIGALFILFLFGLAARASKLWPKSKLAFFIESSIDMVFNLLDDTFGDSKKTFRHFPLLICLLFLILVGNISGLLPGIDTITYNSSEGAVPLFRSWTTDLNTTLALAVLSLATVHYYAVKEIGFRGYARHFFSGKLTNPMTWFIGINELFGEILRLVTLSLRLFGVIYGGEALLFAISALAGNFGWAAAFPIILLEIFVSLVQAYLFMMLTASYIVMSTTHGAEEEPHGAQAAPAKS
jgi:F-type H+-transporting ATPase subunit a